MFRVHHLTAYRRALADTYLITFSGLKCDRGLPLLETADALLIPYALANISAKVTSARLQASTEKVNGELQVSFSGSQFDRISADTTGRELRMLLLGLNTGLYFVLFAVFAV